MQRPAFTSTSPSGSASILIAKAGGSAANERRAQKTIMNCFRDRTPSYVRSKSNITSRGEQDHQLRQNDKGTSEAIGLAKEPKARPLQLSLLKSFSTREVHRLMDLEKSTTSLPSPTTPQSTASSTDSKMTISSSSTTSSSSKCAAVCVSRVQKLERRMEQLEQQLEAQTTISRDLQTQLLELGQRFDQMLQEQELSQKGKKKKGPHHVQSNVQPSKLVAWRKLSNLWKQRPSIQTLKEKNIYNDEPCFDTEIEMVLKDEVHKTVPKIVVDCCQLIEEKYCKSTEPIEGIYRQCGDYNKIQALRFRIDANDYGALRQPNIDIHTLTGVLKLFLREIKSPLVSANEAKTFIGSKPNQWLLTELPSKLDVLRRLICSLPEVNRDTMEFLFAHFNKLTKVPLQQVSAETLSLSVTPSIFHTVPQGARMQDMHLLLREGEVLADCVKTMIEYHNRIFEADLVDRKQPKQRISIRSLKKTFSHPDLIFQTLF